MLICRHYYWDGYRHFCSCGRPSTSVCRAERADCQNYKESFRVEDLGIKKTALKKYSQAR